MTREGRHCDDAALGSHLVDAKLALAVRPRLKPNRGLRNRVAAGIRATPIGLIATAAALAFVAPELARDSFLPEIAKTWIIVGDLGEFLVYVALVTLIYLIAVAARCPRYVLAAGLLAWLSALYGLQGLGAVVVLALAAWAFGLVLIELAGPVVWKRVEALPFIVGLAAILGIAQVAVFFPIFTVGSVTAFLLVIIILFHSRLVEALALAGDWFCAPLERSHASTLALAPILVAAILLVYGSFPETHSDALVAHLHIAHQVSVHRNWSFDASLYTFATMPKGAVWLFSTAYALGGESATRLFNVCTSFLTAWLIYSEVTRYGERAAGALLAGLFLSTPLTFWCVFVLFEDAVLTLFVTTAVVVLGRDWQRLSVRTVVLIGMLLSAATATKIQGLLAAAPIAIVVFVRLAICRSLRDVAVAAGLSAVPVLAIGAVPYMTAWFLTGNPVFPFWNAVFNSPLFPAVNFVDDRWTDKAGWTLVWRLTFHTSELMEGRDGGFGLQHVVMLPGILSGLLFEKRRAVLVAALASLLVFAAVVPFTQYARYLYVSFPLFFLAAVSLWDRSISERWNAGLQILLTAVLAFNIFAARSLNYFYSFLVPNPFSENRHPQPGHPAERVFNSMVNATYGREARVLYLERAYAAGLDGTALYVVAHIGPAIADAVQKVSTAEGLGSLLRRYEITHVISDDDQTPINQPAFQKFLPEFACLQAKIGHAKLWRIEPTRHFTHTWPSSRCDT
jgi:hypothetical protein